MTPYKVEDSNGNVCVTGPSLPVPRAFFVRIDAQQFAEYLNAAWNDGWNQAFRERPTDG
jgi:hypothetical protein